MSEHNIILIVSVFIATTSAFWVGVWIENRRHKEIAKMKNFSKNYEGPYG